MNKSESIKLLAGALAEFQASIGAVSKDGINPFFKSKYASLDNIVKTIRGPLSAVGLSFSQFPTSENELTTILMHTSGEWISSSFNIHPVDGKPQSLGSAITYGRRYAISAVLGLVTEEDDDGAQASGNVEPKSKSAQPKAATDIRNKLMKLMKDHGIDPFLRKEELAAEIKALTGIEFFVANYPLVIKRMEELL